jgi:hypothetical protein
MLNEQCIWERKRMDGMDEWGKRKERGIKWSGRWPSDRQANAAAPKIGEGKGNGRMGRTTEGGREDGGGTQNRRRRKHLGGGNGWTVETEEGGHIGLGIGRGGTRNASVRAKGKGEGDNCWCWEDGRDFGVGGGGEGGVQII